ASSTTMTRISSGADEIGTLCLAGTTTLIATPDSSRTPRTQRSNRNSDQADFLELGLDDLLVERLHDVLVGAGVQRAGDVGDVVLRGAEHHLRPVAAGKPPQRLEELVAVHLRHV